MTTGTRNMLKRCAAIMTALLLLVAFVPEIKTEASATGAIPLPIAPPTGLAPIIPGMTTELYQSAVDLVDDGITALSQVLLALQRSVGVSYVNSSGANISKNQATVAANSAISLYNAMSEAEKAVVWAQAQAVAAGNRVVEFTQEQIENAKAYFIASNKTQSTTVVGGIPIYATQGVTLKETVDAYSKVGAITFRENGKFVTKELTHVMFPVQQHPQYPNEYGLLVYDANGLVDTAAATYPKDSTTYGYFYAVIVIKDYNGNPYSYASYMIRPQDGVLCVFNVGTYSASNQYGKCLDKYLTPPVTYKNDAPVTYPSQSLFEIPPIIGTGDLINDIAEAAAVINSVPAENVWVEPVAEPTWGDFPDVLPDALDFLNEKMQGIGALELVWRQFLELDAFIRSHYDVMTGDDIAATMDVLSGLNEWLYEGSLPGVWPGVPNIVDVVAQELERLEIKYGDPDPEPDPDPDPEPAGIFAMFPFCIPWDVMAFFEALAAPPVEPRFEVDIFGGLYGDAGTIVIEFSRFENIRILVRNCILIVLIVGLMFATKQYIWTGGG